MLFTHYKHVPDSMMSHFPNFSFEGDPRLYCRLTKEFFYDYSALAALQRYREIGGKPVKINSGHRSELYNSRVGGAPLSQHRRLAFDVSIEGKDPVSEYEALKKAGFRSFGFYRTFIHVDLRKGRKWFGSKTAKSYWQSQKGFEFK